MYKTWVGIALSFFRSPPRLCLCRPLTLSLSFARAHTEIATGGSSFGPSPNFDEDHLIFELKFPAMSGGFSVQFKDPGPSNGCELVDDPFEHGGTLTPTDGANIVPVCTPSADEDCEFFSVDTGVTGGEDNVLTCLSWGGRGS